MPVLCGETTARLSMIVSMTTADRTSGPPRRHAARPIARHGPTASPVSLPPMTVLAMGGRDLCTFTLQHGKDTYES